MTSPIIYSLPRSLDEYNTAISRSLDEGCSDNAFLAQCDLLLRCNASDESIGPINSRGNCWMGVDSAVHRHSGNPNRAALPGYQTHRTSVRGLSYCSSSCCRSPVLWASLRKGCGTALERTRGPYKGWASDLLGQHGMKLRVPVCEIRR